MKENEPIEVDVQLDFKDFWKVLFWQNLKSSWYMYMLFFVITLPIFSLYFYALMTDPSKAKFSPLIIFPLLPLVIILLNQWSVYSSAKRSIESVKGKIQWLFSDAGFDVFTAISKSENNWETIEKIEESKGYFLIYPQKNVFMLIPQRSFLNESEIHTFRHLVVEKLGKKAKIKV